MKKLIKSDGSIVGYFKEILEQANGYLCDGAEYQFTVVGTCTFEDYDDELPDRRNPDDVAKQIREERDEKLTKSDWITVKAVDQNAQDGLGIQIPQVWIDYRQALRDIPNQDAFPLNVIWPEEP